MVDGSQTAFPRLLLAKMNRGTLPTQQLLERHGKTGGSNLQQLLTYPRISYQVIIVVSRGLGGRSLGTSKFLEYCISRE